MHFMKTLSFSVAALTFTSANADVCATIGAVSYVRDGRCLGVKCEQWAKNAFYFNKLQSWSCSACHDGCVATPTFTPTSSPTGAPTDPPTDSPTTYRRARARTTDELETVVGQTAYHVAMSLPAPDVQVRDTPPPTDTPTNSPTEEPTEEPTAKILHLCRGDASFLSMAPFNQVEYSQARGPQ
jgi:hypothetical protein